MRIRHENTAAGDTLTVGDDSYSADSDGWFDVPHAFGATQSRFAGWRQDLGEDAAAAAADLVDSPSNLAAALEKANARIAELEAALAATKPAKAAAKKAAATV